MYPLCLAYISLISRSTNVRKAAALTSAVNVEDAFAQQKVGLGVGLGLGLGLGLGVGPNPNPYPYPNPTPIP